jgi:hypothetical protein
MQRLSEELHGQFCCKRLKNFVFGVTIDAAAVVCTLPFEAEAYYLTV